MIECRLCDRDFVNDHAVRQHMDALGHWKCETMTTRTLREPRHFLMAMVRISLYLVLVQSEATRLFVQWVPLPTTITGIVKSRYDRALHT